MLKHERKIEADDAVTSMKSIPAEAGFIIMRAKTRTGCCIKAHHRFDYKPSLLAEK